MFVYGNLMVKVFKISIVFKYILDLKYFNKILNYYIINFEIIDYNKIIEKYDFYNYFVIIIFLVNFYCFLVIK